MLPALEVGQNQPSTSLGQTGSSLVIGSISKRTKLKPNARRSWADHGLRDQLCLRCNMIDFRHLFQHGLSDQGADYVELGTSRSIRRASRCPLCRLVVELLDQRSLKRDCDELEAKGRELGLHVVTSDDVLFNFARHNLDPSSYLEHIRKSSRYYEANGLGINQTTTLYTAIVTPGMVGLYILGIRPHLEPKYISLLNEKGLTARYLFNTREIARAQANFKLVSSWLHCCQDRHTRCQGEAAALALTSLQLIDVNTRCLVNSSGNCRYLALSYVYGGVKIAPDFRLPKHPQCFLHSSRAGPLPQNSAPGVCSCPHIELPKLLPQTIEDAILLVKVLGFQFLWVDSLCLDPNDANQQEILTTQMSTVYAGAYITIIAASGTNADAGLPGVRPNSRNVNQHMEVVKGMRFVVSMPSLQHQISKSKWATRAWTFQEGLMCGRYLIFTEEQVYWECRQAGFCEAVEEPFELFSDMTPLPSFNRALGAVSVRSRGDFNATYIDLVSTYSHKNLTYETDVLNAFAGIIKVLEVTFNLQFCWGIPQQKIPEFLFWNSSRFSPSGCRRTAFPSWTWASWSGAIEFFILTKGQQEMEGDRTILYNGHNWCPRFIPGQFSCQQNHVDKRILNCQARTALFTLSPRRNRMKALWPGLPLKEGQELIRMDCDNSNSQGYEGRVIEFMECGLFTKYDPPIWRSRVLLISWNQDTASRIGAGEMPLEMFETAGPVKKVVKLG